jgi:hypothetical protein
MALFHGLFRLDIVGLADPLSPQVSMGEKRESPPLAHV